MPTPTREAREQHDTFCALLGALSRPGRPHALPGGEPFTLLASALLDLEVSAYAPEGALRAAVRATGAALRPAPDAAYLFLPAWDDQAARAVRAARVGTARDPHRAATLFLPASIGAGEVRAWRGPGIDGTLNVQVGLPPGAWATLSAKRAAQRFPLGVDVVFVDRGQLLGLPRSTHTGAVG